MKATVLLALLVLGILVAPFRTDAQPAGKVYRIGRLSAGSPSLESKAREEAFRQGLRELGYVEGQNLVTETATRRGAPSGSPTWRPSSSGSRWT